MFIVMSAPYTPGNKIHVHTCMYTYMYLKKHLVSDAASVSVQQLILFLLYIEFNDLISIIFIISPNTMLPELGCSSSV